MYELYQTQHGSRGSLSEVWIDRQAGLVRKQYKPNGITITGNHPLHTDMDEIRRLYENEVSWSESLRSDMVVPILDHGSLADDTGWFILQPYYGPDLLHYFKPDTRLSHRIPDATEQIIRMFQWYKAHDLYKYNNAMANMTLHGDRLVAFDFKYAARRTAEKTHVERASITKWIAKIDPLLPEMLESLI